MMAKPEGKKSSIGWGLGFILCLGVYLIAAHYAKPYSDPFYFLGWAEDWTNGERNFNRALVFPWYLAQMLTLIGRDWIFLANLPWVLLMALGVYFTTLKVAEQAGRGQSKPLTTHVAAGLIACFALFSLRWGVVLQILNPYREPIAFAALMWGVFCFIQLKQRPLLWGMLGGLLFGLSTSARETGLISLLVAGCWTAGHVLKYRTAKWWSAGVLTFIMMLLGLFPFFIQNYQKSHSLLVPGYMVNQLNREAPENLEKVVSEEESVEQPKKKIKDIPIPGLSLKYFSSVGPSTIKKMVQYFRWPGVALAFWGICILFLRNRAVLLGFLLPQWALYTLFYCFYNYLNSRYVFVVDLFSVIVIGLGASDLLWRIGKLARKFYVPRRAQILLALLFVVLSFGHMAINPVTTNRLKCWNIDAFRQFGQSHLKAPATWLGMSHHASMMGWIFNNDKDGFYNAFGGGEVGKDIHAVGVDGMFEKRFNKFRPILDSQPHYLVGDEYWRFFRNWFLLDPVFFLADSPVPIDRYGKPMEQTIFQVLPWQKLEVEVTCPVPKTSEQLVLLLDPYRLWDYKERTRCELSINGKLLPTDITNGPQFITVPEGYVDGDSMIVSLKSDAPLPEAFGVKAYPYNETFKLTFGLNDSPWYYPYISDSFILYELMTGAGFVLFDKGYIDVPRIADTNTIVVAHFRHEWQAGHGKPFDVPHLITGETEDCHFVQNLPATRTTRQLPVSLGRGQGKVDMVRVHLSTPFPSGHQQNNMFNNLELEKMGIMKFYDCSLNAYPVPWVSELKLNVGSREDAPYLLRGYHKRRDIPTGRRFRWTDPEAETLLPLVGGADRQLLLEVQTLRGDESDLEPVASVGQEVLTFVRRDVDAESNTARFIYALPASVIPSQQDYRLTVVTPPHLSSEMPERPLGLCLFDIQVLSVSPPSL